MRRAFILPLILICACSAPVPPQARMIPVGPPPERIEFGFDKAAIEYDLLTTARVRFGEPAVRRALGSPAYLFAKHYPGMMPPPPPNAGSNWRYPDVPMSILIRANGQWLAATPSGFRRANMEAVKGIETILNDRQFWAEPEWGRPGCTDAGASIFMLKVPGRTEIIRRGVCGPAPLGERLVFQATQG